MKEIGDVSYVLGAKIYSGWSKIILGLSQRTYLSNSLERFNLHNWKLVSDPSQKESSVTLRDYPETPKEWENSVDPILKCSMVLDVWMILRYLPCIILPVLSSWASVPAIRMPSRVWCDTSKGQWTLTRVKLDQTCNFAGTLKLITPMILMSASRHDCMYSCSKEEPSL